MKFTATFILVLLAQNPPPSPAPPASTPADDEAERGGRLLSEGKVDEARPVLTAACDAGSGVGCYNLSTLAMKTQHPEQARPYATRSCDLGWALGCADLGWMLVRGIGGPVDLAQGYKWTAHACEKGWGTSCGEQAELLVSGATAAPDPVAAFPLMARACETSRDPRFCAELGGMYESGLGTTKDLAQAEGAYGQACRMGNADACGRLPYVVRDQGDANRAYAVSAELCGQQQLDNCVYQGTALIKGWGVPVDLKQAIKLCTAACDQNSFEGCGCLALAEDAKKPGSKASNDALQRACAIAPERCAP